VKSWGTKIVSSATTVEEALWLQDHGVDAIIAQGLEAGGHRGMFLNENITTQIGTLALLPQVVASVQVPVIAAGGIANAASVAAAMALGAAGVQVGTAFLLCHEATTSSVHKAALSSAQSTETALTNLFSGRPARGIVNRIMREKGPMSTTVPAFPFAPAALAPLRACAEASGSGDFSPLWAGQNASNCKAVPASDLVRELAAFDSL
jgi:nitronate monooxygenase